MRKPVHAELADQLEGEGIQVYLIGDALAPRSLFTATYEGQRFARMIGERSVPQTTSDALFEPIPDDTLAQPASMLLREGRLAANGRIEPRSGWHPN